MARRKRGLTPSSQAVMHSPLSVQACAHFRDASSPWPSRRMSRIPRRIQLVSATLSNLTNLRDQEVCHGDVADSVHGSAEGRAMGAMEERAKYCGNLSGAGKEEQDRR